MMQDVLVKLNQGFPLKKQQQRDAFKQQTGHKFKGRYTLSIKLSDFTV